MAESNFLKSLAMQQAVLPPAAPSIGSTLDKLKELDADAPLKLDTVLKMELPFKEASIQAKEKSLTAKTSNTKKKELADNYIQLGDIYSRLNRKDEAQKAYGKAYVLWKGMNPKNEELSTDLTRVFAEQGKVAEAKNICSSISDFTFKTMAEDSLILGLAKSGKFAEAEKLLAAEVSKIESDHSGERRLAGYVEVYLIEKKLDKALSLAELAVKKTNSDVGYDTALEVNAKVESLLGHYEKAEACLQAAHDYLANRYPTDPPKLPLYRKLAELYLINKKYPQALTICDQIISKYDNFDRQCVLYSDVLGLKAQVLAAQSSPLAAETFQKALDIKSKIQDPKDKSVVDLKLAYDKFQNQSKH